MTIKAEDSIPVAATIQHCEDTSETLDLEQARTVTVRLFQYCQSYNWAGYDPYDALNSKVYEALPFLRRRLVGISLTQLLKRCPINLRPLLRVPRAQNPKGLALFISALLKLGKMGFINSDKPLQYLLQRLALLRSPDTACWCWGYHFPWQSRGAFFPRWIPNAICTTFAGNALLDAYEHFGDEQYLDMARSAAGFILGELYHEEPDGICCISYMPLARSRVHNANLLAAAFLCRAARLSGERNWIEPALNAARYSVSCQHRDGSWDYGESDSPPQRWIDNFHSGFNLCALKAIAANTDSSEWQRPMQHGYEYYREHFFTEEGAPKYFNNRLYPVDIHSVAQSLITLTTFRDLDPDGDKLCHAVWRWALRHMYSEEGYFYFQKLQSYTNRTAYMRWSQAWMLLALSILFESAMEPLAQKAGCAPNHAAAGRIR